MCDNAQLLVYVRFFNTDQKAFCEDLLGVTPFKWVNAGPLQMQLVDLQADVALKEQFVRSDSSTFWLQMVPETAFPGLRKVALHILTMFGSTYNCEAAFSTMNIIKTNIVPGSPMSTFTCMRIALTPFKPWFKILARQARAQFSH